jgi:DNA replication protein DnaC
MKSLRDVLNPEAFKAIMEEKKKLGKSSSWEAQQYECEKCEDSGTIHSIRWVETPDYLDKFGEPFKQQLATVHNCSCRFEKMFAKFNATVGMKEPERHHVFKTAEADKFNEKQLKMACDFIRDIEMHREIGSWIYIFGDETRASEQGLEAYGTGKSHLMQCIGNALTERRIPAIYVTEDKLFQDIKDTYNRESAESESEVLNRYYNVPILLIDDLFTAQYKDWAESKLYSILNTRKSDKKITIITTNYAVNRIKDRLPINGAKIASRIIEESILIEMIGVDRRPKQGKKKADLRRQWWD